MADIAEASQKKLKTRISKFRKCNKDEQEKEKFFNKLGISFTINVPDENSEKEKMINIFMWIIGYQSNAQEILKNYVNFLQSYIEVIRDSSDNKEVVDIASKFLNTVLIKIKS